MPEQERLAEAARALWTALRDLSDDVEGAEATGICLPDRVAALIARDTLYEYNDVVLETPQLEETPDGGMRQIPSTAPVHREEEKRNA